MNGSFDVSTVVFAVLAVFVVWKLRSVLGTRTGAERPPTNPFARRGTADAGKPGAGAPDRGNVVPLPGAAPAVRPVPAAPVEVDRWAGVAAAGSPLAAGLDAIARADPAFDVRGFMDGARIAYETIILAFAKGDKGALAPLLAKDVFDGFVTAIDQREARGETVDTTFVAMDQAVIEDAQLRGRMEQVSIRFETKLISVVRKGDGTVTDGDPDRVSDIIDHWTFAREIGSRDPNWRLIATEAVQ